jgi:hypothetical protein
MFDNGVVGFMDPAGGNNGGQQYWAEPFRNNIGPRFNYMIAPLWTDLLNYSGSFTTEGTAEFQRYNWNNISQFGYPDRLNTFSLEIKPSGYIGVNYQMINIQGYPISTGIIGNAALGEWTQQQYFDSTQPLGLTIPNWSFNGTGLPDPCLTDPLSSSTCEGYAAAYLSQQCTISALYSPACPGYAQAYFTQQCTANPLYDVSCPGYAQAYLTYQCSLDALYSTTCEGYEQAYFTQQCSLDGLYSKQCPNYAEAYATAELLKPASIATQETTNDVKVALVSDPAVNSIITSTTTSTSPATPVAPVQLVQAAPAVVETRMETTNASSSSSSSTSNTQTASTENKTTPTARQQLQARREAAARAKAVEDGKNLASSMGKATDMEQQITVQNVVLSAMGFVPGFDAYSRVMIVQSPFYKPEQIYKNQVNVDNALVGRRMFSGTDGLHNEMVDSQYNLGK